MGQGERFKKFEHLVHPYSGLDPESWTRFLTSIKTFERLVSTDDLDNAAKALYSASEYIRDIGLSIRRPDDGNIKDDLNKIASELGYEGEMIINQIAIQKGIYFFPRYLNDMNKDFPENVPELRTVRSHGQ